MSRLARIEESACMQNKLRHAALVTRCTDLPILVRHFLGCWQKVLNFLDGHARRSVDAMFAHQFCSL